MNRRCVSFPAFVALVLTVVSTSPALAIDEPERLWMVGERAFADGLYPVAGRALQRFVDRYPRDARAPAALLLLGKAKLTLGDTEGALEALRRARSEGAPGQGLEARFWEGETLFRLKRWAEARAAYDEILRTDAAASFAPDALYGYGWAELELRRPEPAVTAFREFLQTWGEHPLAPSATYQLARALVDLKRYAEALPILADFAKKFPGHKLVPDARYLSGWARLQSGDVKGGATELRAFAEAYPNHLLTADARRALRDTLAKTGDRGQLQDLYASLMSQSPATAENLAEALTIATRLGRARDQEAAWRKLRTQFAEHPLTQKAGFDLATAAFKHKDWKSAVSYAEPATASADDGVRAEAWLLTGESELKLKRFPAAAKAFEEVGATAGADAGTRYRALAGLGLAREELKDWRAALAAYDVVAAKSGDTALRQWARDRASAVRARLPKSPAKGKGAS